MIRRFHFLMPFLFPALCLANMPTGNASTIIEEIKKLEQEFGGHLGVMAKNLATGDVVAYRADERFPTASAIKFPMMTAFFHLVDQKKIDPQEKVVLHDRDKKQGSGILQLLSEGSSLTLLDAVRLMITLSDNTATNLVLDRLSDTHDGRMSVVNDFMVAQGLKNTRILNRLYSKETKKLTPEGIRYGIGVATPEDIVILLESLFKGTLADSSSCKAMLEILKQQSYRDMIPRFLPDHACTYLDVANKTGGVNETKVDVGLVFSDKVNYAVAIFVDKHPDHREGPENQAVLLAANVSRAIWNHFTGMTGYHDRKVITDHVDWNALPGGNWVIWRSTAAPFPHKDRVNGFTTSNGTIYPYNPHYADSSITVFIPNGFKESPEGSNVIVHFHGHMNDNMGVLEQFGMPQALLAQKINALLVLPQGPYRARDSFGGKMEDEGGLRRLVEEVLTTMKKEEVVKSTSLRHLLVTAHSGGYRPAAISLEKGGLSDKITDVFLFDALYGQHEYFRNWLERCNGNLYGAYTDHLGEESVTFEKAIQGEAKARLHFTPTTVSHNAVVQEFFGRWLDRLGPDWKTD